MREHGLSGGHLGGRKQWQALELKGWRRSTYKTSPVLGVGVWNLLFGILRYCYQFHMKGLAWYFTLFFNSIYFSFFLVWYFRKITLGPE